MNEIRPILVPPTIKGCPLVSLEDPWVLGKELVVLPEPANHRCWSGIRGGGSSNVGESGSGSEDRISDGGGSSSVNGDSSGSRNVYCRGNGPSSDR